MLLNTYEPWKFAFSVETDFDNIKKDSYGIIGVPFDKVLLLFVKLHMDLKIITLILKHHLIVYSMISVMLMWFLQIVKLHVI